MPSPIQADWAKIRRDYENSNRPIPDICAEHGISAGTLRDRVRRWGWARRWLPIPAEGPPAMIPTVEIDPVNTDPWLLGPHLRGDERGEIEASSFVGEGPSPPPASAAANCDAEPSPYIANATPDDTTPIGERLQSAVSRVLPAIEATLTKLAAGPMRPREMEQAARALGSLTRTLRELNALLPQHQPAGSADDDDMPEDLDEFRLELARRINVFVASRKAKIPTQYEAAWNEFADRTDS
jgi:hypothetical protein